MLTSPAPAATLLVADDEPRYLRVVQFNLEASGYQVLTAGNGSQALERAAAHRPDLILLDVRMPGMDGFEVLRVLRESMCTPVIFLTARGTEEDKVAGLQGGADDYITKPFSANELLARIQTVLRRYQPAAPAPQPDQSQGDICIDAARRRVFVRGQEVLLTPTELRLLSEFLRQPRRVMVPSYLLEQVWGDEALGDEKLVWQAVHRLRHKIELDARAPRYIQTRPGMGYVFVP